MTFSHYDYIAEGEIPANLISDLDHFSLSAPFRDGVAQVVSIKSSDMPTFLDRVIGLYQQQRSLDSNSAELAKHIEHFQASPPVRGYIGPNGMSCAVGTHNALAPYDINQNFLSATWLKNFLEGTRPDMTVTTGRLLFGYDRSTGFNVYPFLYDVLAKASAAGATSRPLHTGGLPIRWADAGYHETTQIARDDDPDVVIKVVRSLMGSDNPLSKWGAGTVTRADLRQKELTPKGLMPYDIPFIRLNAAAVSNYSLDVPWPGLALDFPDGTTDLSGSFGSKSITGFARGGSDSTQGDWYVEPVVSPLSILNVSDVTFDTRPFFLESPFNQSIVAESVRSVAPWFQWDNVDRTAQRALWLALLPCCPFMCGVDTWKAVIRPYGCSDFLLSCYSTGATPTIYAGQSLPQLEYEYTHMTAAAMPLSESVAVNLSADEIAQLSSIDQAKHQRMMTDLAAYPDATLYYEGWRDDYVFEEDTVKLLKAYKLYASARHEAGLANDFMELELSEDPPLTFQTINNRINAYTSTRGFVAFAHDPDGIFVDIDFGELSDVLFSTRPTFTPCLGLFDENFDLVVGSDVIIVDGDTTFDSSKELFFKVINSEGTEVIISKEIWLLSLRDQVIETDPLLKPINVTVAEDHPMWLHFFGYTDIGALITAVSVDPDIQESSIEAFSFDRRTWNVSPMLAFKNLSPDRKRRLVVLYIAPGKLNSLVPDFEARFMFNPNAEEQGLLPFSVDS